MMDSTKTFYAMWSNFWTPPGLEAKTVDMKQILSGNLSLCDIIMPPYVPSHGFTSNTLFMTSLEEKNCRYQRKYNQWKNTSSESSSIKIQTKHHNGFTPCTLFAMQNVTDKGTTLNRSCLLLLTVFLSKIIPPTANCYCPSYNIQFWSTIKSFTNHKTYAHCSIT